MGSPSYKLDVPINTSGVIKVSNFIVAEQMRWNTELVNQTFPNEIANRIVRIPLPRKAIEDTLAWRGEPS